MLNNFIQHQYQPYNKIYTHQASKYSLFLGDVSAALDSQFISKEPISLVITAATGMDQVSYPTGQVKHKIYHLLDAKSQNISSFFLDFFHLIEQQLLTGNILVHCAAGISRSATLVISYFMKKFNWAFREAIKFVRQKRPVVLPNLGFQRQLKQFEVQLLNSKKISQDKRIAQSSQFEKRLGPLKSNENRRGLFSPIKRQVLPGIKYKTSMIRSKQLEKNPKGMIKDYVRQIAHRQIDLRMKNNQIIGFKKEIKKKPVKLGHFDNDIIVSKFQTGRGKYLQRSANLVQIKFQNPNQKNNDIFQPAQLIGKKMSSLSHRSQLREKKPKIMRNFSNDSKRSDNILKIYDRASHAIVSKLEFNQRRFVTEKQLKTRAAKRLINF